MVEKHNFQKEPVQLAAAGRRALVGAFIGFTLIALFLAGINPPDPAWGAYWMLRPLLVVPLAGAFGGFLNYLLLRYRQRLGIHPAIAGAISVVVFLVGLWLGFVLGLAGTLWD